MTDENLAALKRLELIHEYIYNECEGNIFYPPEHNRVIFLRIKNAADMLLNKAVKILKQQGCRIMTIPANSLSIQ